VATTPQLNLLFLCTGNSCRSQMAEGWTRQLAGENIRVCSAGIEAHGQNPRALEVMREAGVDIISQESKVLDAEMLADADIVITVCGHADEVCPALPPRTRKLHWPLADPARATGSEEEIKQQFRNTRDEVRGRVESLLRAIAGGQGL